MKMYIANCTHQIKQFVYSVPGARGPRTQPIDKGGQIQISGELQPEDVNAIVEQHSVYGMFPAQDVAQTRSHITLLYSVGKPVSKSQMEQALERNLALMGDEGARLRQAAAIAVNNTAEDSHPNEFKGMNIEIVEQVKDGGVPFVNEEIVVRPNGEDYHPPVQRGRGRPRKAA